MGGGGGVDTVCAAAGLSKGRYHNVKTAAFFVLLLLAAMP